MPIGSDGGAWAQDPATNIAIGFVPQGIGADLIATLDGFSRDDVDALRAGHRSSAPRRRRRPASSTARSCRSTDFLDQTILERDEFIKPHTTLEGLASLKVAFERARARWASTRWR